MAFKEKSVVRHKLRPDWGAGRVLLRSDEYLQIDFTEGGLKKLKTSIADEHLEAATAEEIKALKPEKVKPAKRAVTAKATVADKTTAAPKTAVASKTTVASKSAVGSKSASAGKTRMV
jgi:uncharacterized protein YdaT